MYCTCLKIWVLYTVWFADILLVKIQFSVQGGEKICVQVYIFILHKVYMSINMPQPRRLTSYCICESDSLCTKECLNICIITLNLIVKCDLITSCLTLNFHATVSQDDHRLGINISQDWWSSCSTVGKLTWHKINSNMQELSGCLFVQSVLMVQIICLNYMSIW